MEVFHAKEFLEENKSDLVKVLLEKLSKFSNIYRMEKKALALTSFKPIADLAISKVATRARTIDILWQMGYEFKKQQPSWSGFMQKYLNGYHSGKATVTFLPIINLNPSNESCKYSTLVFVEQLAQQLNIPTPCITFDHPLFIKAFEISKAKSMNIVIRLGVFHLLTLFFGGIGTIMGGCGLAGTMETMHNTLWFIC